jgi:phosphodiesterase/alkaline phosphatase D-like protein
MLGAAQLEWFERQLREAAKSYAAVVWVNASPWIDDAAVGQDSWGGFAGEREHIGKMIDELGLSRRLVMLSGDAHMVAIDNGTNSGYGGAGFPVFHAAALDRPGGVKGGPYSEGTFPGAGQFGTLAVHDSGGNQVTMTLTGRTWDGRVLVEHSVDVDTR